MTSNRGLRDQERQLIESALARCHGQISGARGAAAQLGLPPTTLESMIKRHGIDKRQFRRLASAHTCLKARTDPRVAGTRQRVS